VQQPGHAAELRQQFFGQGHHVFALYAGAQQQGQQLGIAERAGATGQQLFAGAGFFGQVFELHGKGGELRSVGHTGPAFYNRGSLATVPLPWLAAGHCLPVA